MKLVLDRAYGEVDLTASAEQLNRLASAVGDGEGLLGPTSAPGGDHLAGVEVETSSGPGVRIRLDAPRHVLVISGDPVARAALADDLRAMAAAEDGGHLHIDYFPDHPYLMEGTLSLVVNSPHGGMPTR
ncbi:Imm32 family immunity protein [Streptomyces sp. CA-249302]|uniref:Imm32 family immunity protein n=1 Tax=Streptomyces sp. CA-249302 TaxID=3240058 RepID=UPI003D90F648